MKPARIACALLLLCACASRTQLKIGKTDDGEVVEAEGMVPYTGEFLAIKRASLVDAQKNAVEKAVGVFVSGRTFVEKAVAIENNILARTEGYVKKYDVIKEWREGDFYHTKIRALVALKDLEKDLKDMSLLQGPELSRPRVLVRVTEKIQKDAVDDKPAAAALQKQLTDNGYSVVLSTGEAVPPDLLISGTATAYPFQAEGLGGFVSYRARLTVEAVRPGTAKAVASLSKEASGLGGNPELAALKALETVGNLVGEELAKQLTANWSNKKTVFVAIEGVASFAEVDRIKKHFSAEPGVKDLVLRTYDEGMAQFEVELDNISSEQLAARMEASQSLPLKVIEAKSQTIRLSTKK
jgi:hypothetical protein